MNNIFNHNQLPEPNETSLDVINLKARIKDAIINTWKDSAIKEDALFYLNRNLTNYSSSGYEDRFFIAAIKNVIDLIESDLKEIENTTLEFLETSANIKFKIYAKILEVMLNIAISLESIKEIPVVNEVIMIIWDNIEHPAFKQIKNNLRKLSLDSIYSDGMLYDAVNHLLQKLSYKVKDTDDLIYTGIEDRGEIARIYGLIKAQLVKDLKLPENSDKPSDNLTIFRDFLDSSDF